MFRIRLIWTLLVTVVLLALIAWLAPQQLEVSLYKLSLLTLAALAGYWIDRELFPYARPDGYLAEEWRVTGNIFTVNGANYAVADGYRRVFAAAMLRRALIVAAAMVAVGLGA